MDGREVLLTVNTRDEDIENHDAITGNLKELKWTSQLIAGQSFGHVQVERVGGPQALKRPKRSAKDSA